MIPSGLNYRTPKGINPGDTLTVEQIKQYAPGLIEEARSTGSDLSEYKHIFTPAGTHIYSDANLKGCVVNKFTKSTSGHTLTVSDKSKHYNPIQSWSGNVFFMDGTRKGLGSGSLQETLKADELNSMDYSIITNSGYLREGNIVFLTFY